MQKVLASTTAEAEKLVDTFAKSRGIEKSEARTKLIGSGFSRFRTLKKFADSHKAEKAKAKDKKAKKN